MESNRLGICTGQPARELWHQERDGRALVLLGIKREEENNKDEDKKFEVKLAQSGYKPDEIKVQFRGQELAVTVRHITVRLRSNQDCHNYTQPVQT